MTDHPFLKLCGIVCLIALLSGHSAYGGVRNQLPSLISKEVLPSIVAIKAETAQVFRKKPSAMIVPKKGMVILQRFKTARAVKSGMGFIVSEDGLIATNEHTLSGVNDVSIIMFDGKEVPGEIVWRHPKEDFALISIKTPGKLRPIPFADSNELKSGQRVFAIVSKVSKDEIIMAALPGRVIGMKKNVFWEERKVVFPEVIATNIHLYYGASGGPLITTNGELVGMDSAGYIYENFSFAMPSNRIKILVEDYLKRIKRTRS